MLVWKTECLDTDSSLSRTASKSRTVDVISLSFHLNNLSLSLAKCTNYCIVLYKIDNSTMIEFFWYTHFHKWLPEINKQYSPTSTFTTVRSTDSSLLDYVVRVMQTVGDILGKPV